MFIKSSFKIGLLHKQTESNQTEPCAPINWGQQATIRSAWVYSTIGVLFLEELFGYEFSLSGSDEILMNFMSLKPCPYSISSCHIVYTTLQGSVFGIRLHVQNMDP